MEYLKAHGRSPRGFGHWGFTFDKPRWDELEDIWWAPQGWFADARRLAVAEAKKRGARVVHVQP